MSNVFTSAVFIKPDVAFNPVFRMQNLAPMFRKRFTVKNTKNARLYVCGLGYGYYYINGRAVSEDLFTAPISHYDRTLWYTVYDVTDLLVEGENLCAVICGNGFFNEEFRSSWNNDQAPYRDNPKFILRLSCDGEDVLLSDGDWKCKPESATWFNALRSGEYFDATCYEKDWAELTYDDRDWARAAVDQNPPKGVFRECLCEPIREHEVYDPIEVYQVRKNVYIFDLGRNISGYIRLHVTGHKHEHLTIRYAECVLEDGSLNRNGVTGFYPESDFQTDRFIASGEEITWSPKFVYHGFRYIEITGLKNLDGIRVQGVFVHQAVPKRTSFLCSDEDLNRLYEYGCVSSYSNMFYLLSDCPTREKLGWTNDAQMSAEQMLTNFQSERLFEKWMRDIYDAMREDGALPGIVPTPEWGYEWGSGPLSNGVLFELPYRLYLHTGDAKHLCDALPYMLRYFEYLRTKENEEGWVPSFGLGDWCTVGDRADIPVQFVNAVLQHKFYCITSLAAALSGDGALEKEYADRASAWKDRIIDTYIAEDGTSRIEKLSAVAILIYHGMYRELAPLKAQIKEYAERQNFLHDCGILGLRCLYEALNACGLQEYAYRFVTAEGFPSYRFWLERGATTFWECFKLHDDRHYDSRNHHMFSDVLSWMIKTILGVTHQKTDPSAPELTLQPYYFEALTYAKGSYLTDGGALDVEWHRDEAGITLSFTVTGDARVSYNGRDYTAGTYQFQIR